MSNTTSYNDNYVTELIQGHVFSGHSPAWTSPDGKYSFEAYDWEDSGWEAWKEYAGDQEVRVEDLGLVKLVESFGGEGLGDQYYLIFFVDAGEWEQHYKLSGYYSSYGDGGYYEAPLYKVSPVERVVTFWK